MRHFIDLTGGGLVVIQDSDFDGNEFIEDAIHQCYLQEEKDRPVIKLISKEYDEGSDRTEGLVRESPEDDYLIRNVLEAVGYCMNLGNYFVLSITEAGEGHADLLAYSWEKDGENEFEICSKFNLEKVETTDGRNLICAFTSEDEFYREYRERGLICPPILIMPIEETLRYVQDQDHLDGILINRWGERFLLAETMYEIDDCDE